MALVAGGGGTSGGPDPIMQLKSFRMPGHEPGKQVLAASGDMEILGPTVMNFMRFEGPRPELHALHHHLGLRRSPSSPAARPSPGGPPALRGGDVRRGATSGGASSRSSCSAGAAPSGADAAAAYAAEMRRARAALALQVTSPLLGVSSMRTEAIRDDFQRTLASQSCLSAPSLAPWELDAPLPDRHRHLLPGWDSRTAMAQSMTDSLRKERWPQSGGRP
mmetsp:Transcript_20217/g.47727  ORF Transcript_20217/g.47727 Transcript_20217/m.47727 type:complete len:220 (-) Transcript_20217:27-686(-)